MAAKPSLASTRALPGVNVYSPLGAKIGLLQELVIDLQSGQVKYAIVLFSFDGGGAEAYHLPWGALNYDGRLGGFHTYVTQSQLKTAPDAAHTPEWETKLMIFYGVLPRGHEPS